MSEIAAPLHRLLLQRLRLTLSRRTALAAFHIVTAMRLVILRGDTFHALVPERRALLGLDGSIFHLLPAFRGAAHKGVFLAFDILAIHRHRLSPFRGVCPYGRKFRAVMGWKDIAQWEHRPVAER